MVGEMPVREVKWHGSLRISPRRSLGIGLDINRGIVKFGKVRVDGNFVRSRTTGEVVG